jgi:hypothetical protein
MKVIGGDRDHPTRLFEAAGYLSGNDFLQNIGRNLDVAASWAGLTDGMLSVWSIAKNVDGIVGPTADELVTITKFGLGVAKMVGASSFMVESTSGALNATKEFWQPVGSFMKDSALGATRATYEFWSGPFR